MGVSVCSTMKMSRRKQSRGGARTQKRTKKLFKTHKGVRTGAVLTKANYKLIAANEKRQKTLNVRKILGNNDTMTNNSANVFEDSEWADKVFDKFTRFLERLQNLEDSALKKGGEGDLLSDISILKIDIASKLIEAFKVRKSATKATAKVSPKVANKGVNSFDDDLTALLSKISL